MNISVLIYGFIFLIFGVGCNGPSIQTKTLIDQPSNKKTPDPTGINTNYFVSKKGNDKNDGTFSKPFLTIGKGLEVAHAGDTTFVMEGNYQEYVEFKESGTVDHPLTLKNYKDDIVTIDAENLRVCCINAQNISNVVIEGILIQNATKTNLKITGCQNIVARNITSLLPISQSSTAINIRLNPDNTNWGKNIILKNVTTTGGQYGLLIEEKQNGVNISGHFSHASIDGINIQIPWVTDTTQYNRGIIVDSVEVDHNARQGIVTLGLKNSIFRNFYSHHNGASGLQIEDYCYGILIEDFICEYNSQSALYTYETGIWINKDDGVIIRRGILRNNQTGLRVSESRNVLASDLLIYSNQSGYGDGNSSGIDFNSSRVELYNSVINGNSLFASQRGNISLRDSGQYVLKNNIISNSQSSNDLFRTGSHKFASDSNLIYNSRVLNIFNLYGVISWETYKRTTNQDAHSVNSDPLFIDSNNNDFRLQPSSPAKKNGRNIGIKTFLSGSEITGNKSALNKTLTVK